MFFTPIAPAAYRTNARLGLERFLQEVARPQHTPPTQFEQDEHQYRLSKDTPGVSRDQLVVQIEEQMVQIDTKEQLLTIKFVKCKSICISV